MVTKFTTKERAMKNIIANVGKEHPTIQGAWIEDGKQIVCDGYRAVRLNDFLDLPVAPGGMDIKRVFKDFTRGAKLELPKTIAELKVIAKQLKDASFAPIYDFGTGLPQVNIKYLIEILQILPDATVYASESKATIYPIYFESDFGDAILLPVRKRQE